ncbi:MAG: cysteine synthase A [Solirubrobacterales bacterium]|nr:cysteine synthase A [Solirubrobacterales bacterium]
MPAIASNIVELMGGTPLVQLTRLSDGLPGTVAVKLEAFNPAGSVKDRIGVSMIEAAEKDGRIEPGRTTIVEATSGNTGIALAFVAAAKGYKLILALPEGMSRERQGLLKLYGAKVEIVESMGGMGEAVDAARKLARSDEYFLPDQFANEANPDVHRRTTAEEIWSATGGKVDVFVAGVGTGGTITGVGERLKERKAGVKVIAVEPAASPVLSGGAVGPHRIQGIGAGFVPPVLNRGVLDEIVPIEDDDAVDTAREVTQKEGISCGISGGAAVRAALDVAARPESKGKLIVTVVPDSGERYISLPFFTQ